jgi:hypothetical protein
MRVEWVWLSLRFGRLYFNHVPLLKISFNEKLLHYSHFKSLFLAFIAFCGDKSKP